MDKASFQIPIVLITFNRPDVTQVVLDRILEINPAKLYFFNDAPRPGNENDRVKCGEIREMASRLNFGGELLTRFEEKNLGCKGGESTAMTWLFDNEEMGIVIEDDTLPTLDFFYYCEEMLHKYRYDDRIFSISGCNQINTWKPENNDYFFSSFGSFWGWAGWQRAWKHYDVNMPLWNDEEVKKLVLNFIPTDEYRQLRTSEFNSLVSGRNDTWDFQFWFAHYINHALSIVPSQNMVVNIGINREDAVHMNFESPYSDLKAHEINLPVRHNPIMVPDYDYDVAVVRKGYPYFYEIPVYPEPPKPTLMQRLSMTIGGWIGEKGLVRTVVNALRGR